VKPEQGLYTAIVGGFLISALGGSRVQIGGPTGAFIVLVYGIVQQHGYAGLAVATMMAELLLIVMGMARLGSVIQFIRYPPRWLALANWWARPMDRDVSHFPFEPR